MDSILLSWFPWIKDVDIVGISLLHIFQAVGLYIVATIVLRLGVRMILDGLSKVIRVEKFAEILQAGRVRIKSWFLHLLPILIAIRAFELETDQKRTVALITSLVILVQGLLIANIWIDLTVRSALAGGRSNISGVSRNISTLTIFAVWTITFMALFDNFGFNVATIIAGLGVGGIAIGLAAQSILGDVFASFAISLDRPFEIGDFIVVDELMGTVEAIGLKTTRIRSLGGELLVFPNSDLVQSRIKNYKKMTERRIVFLIGVTYDTDQSSVRAIPEIIKKCIESCEHTRFDRAHFSQFGACSLDYEVVYFVLSPEFMIYRDIQQSINLQIREEFDRLGIAFAFPTRTIDVPETLIHAFRPPPSTHEASRKQEQTRAGDS